MARARYALMKIEKILKDYPYIKIDRISEVSEVLNRIDAETINVAERQLRDIATFQKLRLRQQCDALNVPMEVISLDRLGGKWIVADQKYVRPEDAALAYMRSLGWDGLACESQAILMLMKASCLDRLASINLFNSRENACIHQFAAQCVIHRKYDLEILQDIEQASEAVVYKNLTEILAHRNFLSVYSPMSIDSLIAVFKVLTPTALAKITRQIFREPSYSSGWPDLTIVRESQVCFVEVKTTDKLRDSQRETISKVIRPNGLDVRVIKIKPVS